MSVATLTRPSPTIDLTVTKSAVYSFRCTPSHACIKVMIILCAKRGVQANRTEERSAPRACRHAEVLSALQRLATPSVDFSAAARCESRDSSGSDEQSIPQVGSDDAAQLTVSETSPSIASERDMISKIRARLYLRNEQGYKTITRCVGRVRSARAGSGSPKTIPSQPAGSVSTAVLFSKSLHR